MEQRLIDANRMKEHVALQKDILVSMGMEEIGNILTKMVFDEINIQPTVDAVPVRHGENITEENEVDQFVCSECGIILEGYIRKIIDEDDGAIDYEEYYMRYCPNCGARMRNVTDCHGLEEGEHDADN